MILFISIIIILVVVILILVINNSSSSSIKQGSSYPSNKTIQLTNNTDDLQYVTLYDSQGNSYLPSFTWPSNTSYTIQVANLLDGDSLQLYGAVVDADSTISNEIQIVLLNTNQTVSFIYVYDTSPTAISFSTSSSN